MENDKITTLINKWREEAKIIREKDVNYHARTIKMDWYILDKCANELMEVINDSE